MCNCTTLDANEKQLAERYQLVLPELLKWQNRFNIKPNQETPIVGLSKDGKRSLKLARWNFNTAISGDFKATVTNARSETILQKKRFAKSFRLRRCLFPVTGFYEWPEKHAPGVPPHYFHLKKIFSLAGLWTLDKANNDELRCLHITTEPNETVGAVHPRMPVILPRDREDDWLNAGPDEEEFLLSLLQPFPDELMEGWLVRPLVNSYKNEDPKCIEPATNEK